MLNYNIWLIAFSIAFIFSIASDSPRGHGYVLIDLGICCRSPASCPPPLVRQRHNGTNWDLVGDASSSACSDSMYNNMSMCGCVSWIVLYVLCVYFPTVHTHSFGLLSYIRIPLLNESALEHFCKLQFCSPALSLLMRKSSHIPTLTGLLLGLFCFIFYQSKLHCAVREVNAQATIYCVVLHQEFHRYIHF